MNPLVQKLNLTNTSCPNPEADLFPLKAKYPDDGMTRDPVYHDLWEMEKEVDLNAWIKWLEGHKYAAVLASILYLASIFTLRKVLANRKPFDLRRALIGWNLGLAIFSALCFMRTAPAIVFLLSQSNGLYVSICTTDCWSAGSVFWGIAFCWSKIVELGDTLFVVLRKKPLIFLHWFHHVTVLCYVWTTGPSMNSTSLWFVVVNCAIHALMYSYYAAKAAHVNVPKRLAMTITSLQLLQMLVGVWINFYVLSTKVTGGHCATEMKDVKYALLMYASYTILFGIFFFKTYVNKRTKTD